MYSCHEFVTIFALFVFTLHNLPLEWIGIGIVSVRGLTVENVDLCKSHCPFSTQVDYLIQLCHVAHIYHRRITNSYCATESFNPPPGHPSKQKLCDKEVLLSFNKSSAEFFWPKRLSMKRQLVPFREGEYQFEYDNDHRQWEDQSYSHWMQVRRSHQSPSPVQ